MKIFLVFTTALFLSFTTIAQENTTNNITKVEYKEYRNGKLNENSNLSFIFKNEIAYLSKSNDKIQSFIDFKNHRNIDIIHYKNSNYKTTTSFNNLLKPIYLDQTETILGYQCSKAEFSYFSNKIEVWYTNKSDIKGSPYKKYLPSKSALVLKIVINGNREIVASKIVKNSELTGAYYSIESSKEISEPEFEEFKIKSRYTTLSVFSDEVINFDPSIKTTSIEDLDNKTYRFSNGSVILKRVKLPNSIKKNAQVYATLTNSSNGDAYDRTGTVFMIPVNDDKQNMLSGLLKGVDELPKLIDNKGGVYQGVISDEKFNSPIELMRFFTSFGVGHFNNLRVINNYPWRKEVVYKQDVSALIPTNQNEVWIGVFIGNYDKGGHKVSLDFDIYPSFEENEIINKWIQPIFNTVNILEMSGQNYGRLFKNDTLKVTVTIPENIKNKKLLFTSTGHGGWGGGDEFNQKLNEVYVDGKLVYSVIPWRTDCATYRLSNPASGNFGNGQSSSDFSRSNWCPGTLTPPYIIPLSTIEPGKHIIEVVIKQGDDEGSSFNHWGVSGVLIGDENNLD